MWRRQYCGSGTAWFNFILGSLIRIRIKVKRRIRIRIKIKIQELWRLKMGPWRAVDAHNEVGASKMEPWMGCRRVVADSHHFVHCWCPVEEQDPDSHQSDKRDPAPLESDAEQKHLREKRNWKKITKYRNFNVTWQVFWCSIFGLPLLCTVLLFFVTSLKFRYVKKLQC